MKMINFRALIIVSFALLLATSVASDDECAADGPQCPDGYCCSNAGNCGYTEAYCSPENCQSQCPDISDIFTESLFDQLLPKRDSVTCPAQGFYTYNDFLTAARRFPEFSNTGDKEIRTRELAAFFAQTSTKTTGGTSGAPDEYEWGYCNKAEPSSTHDCVPGKWPCPPGISYHPRGPIGLEYNYNYGPAGEALGYDLINNPELVIHDPVISFETAIWYWTTARQTVINTTIPSCHDALVGKWTPTKEDLEAGRLPGYGVTINILFPYECGNETEYNVRNSINFYNRSTGILEVGPGENVNCSNQKPFPQIDNLRNVIKMPIYEA
ncbi:hypothetical protein TIFTF001_031139 [Ficus carica]|uniref:Chitin-binding type-1 domain-containing protein n=1 Tax=Ficus carica TaxID=3494 RepID=A0AA88DUH7_FICCA|nr:hypothetical protein TIFTF001_031139 [Ficus carica]